MKRFDVTDVDQDELESPAIMRVREGLVELAAIGSDQWAEGIVQDAAFMHVEASAACRGYTMASSGRAICGNCQWQVSARLEDVGEERSGRFALLVLAWIGLVAGIAAAAEQPCSP